MFIYPYNAASGSVKNLKGAMGDDLKIIRRDNSKFKGDENKIVVNWGCSQLPEEVMKATIINTPEAVSVASNKQLFFERVQGQVNIPPFTADKDEAFKWVEAGKMVVAREKLNGHSGDGIVILENVANFDEYQHDKAKIYVQYIPKQDEYRIHVVGGDVTDMQRKAKRADVPRELANFRVRNLANGFVFVREGVEPPEQVIEQAKLAVEHCGLDFGAVDVIWNEHRKTAYVLEINTAPGLEGTSVETYSESLRKLEEGRVAMRRPRDRLAQAFAEPVMFPGMRPVNIEEALRAHNRRMARQAEPFDFVWENEVQALDNNF